MQFTSLLVIVGASVILVSCAARAQVDQRPYVAASLWVTSATQETAPRQAPDMPSHDISFVTTEGTFMGIDISPDGETLVFDLLGDIYLLPFAGGDAVALTSGRAWDQAPRFSPAGAHVYFVSDREGYKNIWRLALADRSVKQVTRLDSDIMGGPNWSRKTGQLLVGLAVAGTRNTEITLQSVDPITGTVTSIVTPAGPWLDWDTFEHLRQRIRIFCGAQAADGQLYFSEALFDEQLGRITVRMYKFDVSTQTRTAITPVNADYSEYKPQLSHGGKLLAYFRQYNNRRTEIRLLNRATAHDEALVVLASADDASYRQYESLRPNYAFTPDDREIVYWDDGKIRRVEVADGSTEIIPFRLNVEREVWVRAEPAVQHIDVTGEAAVIRWPSVSPDGRTMVFAAIGYVWVMDLQTSAVRRLTSTTDFEYMPAFSPDGNLVAYVSFTPAGDDYGSGRLMVADLDGGAPSEVLAKARASYLLPRWSRDGSMIALIREVKLEAEVQSGIGDIEATFGWTPVTSGAFHEVVSAPASSDPNSWFIYSRFVGFDETGRHLLFSFPRSSKETVLVMARLDGSRSQILANGTPEIGGMTPSPDLKRLALTRRDGTVWVVPFAVDEEQSEVTTATADARRVSSNGGYYVSWNRPDRVTFGFGQQVYRYRLDQNKRESLRVRLPIARPKPEQPIAFTGARLVTMSGDGGAGRVIEFGAVVVDGARIAAIGPASDVVIPADALVIDATGETIVPGLLDTHYHRIGGWEISALMLPNPAFGDPSAIKYGVTTAWEPGGPTNDGVPATIDLQAAGRIQGPRWSHSAMGTVGYPFDLLTTYGAALAAVKQSRALGVGVLKEYGTPTRQQRQWLSAAARETGMGIVSHLNGFDAMMTRIVDGYTGGDHPRIPAPFYNDVRELLRQTGYIWTPNAVITSGTVGRMGDKQLYYCRAIRDWRKRRDRGTDERSSFCAAGQVVPTVQYDTHRVSRVAKQAAAAASNGIHIGVSAHNMPASNLHREMWYLWKGGMPIEDVLRAATIGNAEKLGLQDEVGSLEVGKVADFLVLDGNPLDDILNTLSLKYTVQGGVIYDSNTALPADLQSVRLTDAASASGSPYSH